MSNEPLIQCHNIAAKRLLTKVNLYNRLTKAKTLIEMEVDKNFSIPALAREATISQFHFIRKFQEAFGCSPYRYQLNKRLEMSLALLQDNSLYINDVASRMGFCDIYAFSKAFKKKYGICPSKLREKIKDAA